MVGESGSGVSGGRILNVELKVSLILPSTRSACAERSIALNLDPFNPLHRFNPLHPLQHLLPNFVLLKSLTQVVTLFAKLVIREIVFTRMARDVSSRASNRLYL